MRYRSEGSSYCETFCNQIVGRGRTVAKGGTVGHWHLAFGSRPATTNPHSGSSSAYLRPTVLPGRAKLHIGDPLRMFFAERPTQSAESHILPKCRILSADCPI